MIRRLDALQRRYRSVGYVIGVVYKLVDDQGGYLAALIAYYAFVSLFPILLLLTTGLGFVLDGHPELRQSLINSALGEFPVIGDQLGQPRGLSGGAAGVTVGIIVALYGASGIGQAAQNAMNVAWSVPRNNRPDPFTSRLRSLLLLAVLALTLAGIATLARLDSFFDGWGGLSGVALFLAAVVLNALVFGLGFRVGTTRALTMRDVLPGAFVMALLWQMLQSFGTVYVEHVIRNASATNGVFALVLGLLAFLYLTALAIVISVEINCVRVDHLYPRSLLTPFTDAVVLTRGDRRAYTAQAQAQRAKGFEQIDVQFHPPDDRGPSSS